MRKGMPVSTGMVMLLGLLGSHAASAGVELTLEGPARQSTSVDLYMGPPREFRLGPLPCGEYKLTVRPRGRYRYALVRGDSVLTVRCDGHTQQRVVLEPVKR